MQQIINTANQLIVIIVNAIFFLVAYGTVFYLLGVLVYGIIKTAYDRFIPCWKKWYQNRKHKKR